MNIVTPAILIIGAILVALLAAPLALFSRGLESSGFEVGVAGNNITLTFTWNGLVGIKDASLEVMVDGDVVGSDFDQYLTRGEDLTVTVNVADLQGDNTTIVFSGSVEGIYDFTITLEVKGG